MRQKKRQKLRASDFFITLLCLCVCGVSLWFFWKDLNSSSIRTDIDKIAIIHFKKNISQRKFNDRVVWERLQQDSELYNYDTVRTSDNAEAVIYFADGTKIDLNENTMIQIVVEEDGSVNLSVGNGNIEIDTTETTSSSPAAVKLSLSDGAKITMQKGSRVSAETGENGAAASLVVRDGNAVVAASTGESQQISGGEAVSIEKDGRLSKQKITVTSIPKFLVLYKLDENEDPVKLVWKTAGEGTDLASNTLVIAETAADKKFEKILTSEEVSVKSAFSSSIEIFPQKERIWWRLYFADDLSSAVQGEIKTVKLDKTLLKAPLDNSSFSYRNELPALQFNWSANDYADHYQFEVSKNSDFTEPVISEELKTNSYTINTLSQGQYFWRVKPYYSVNNIGEGQTSPVYTFNIEKTKGSSALQPTLPAENAKIMLSEEDQNIIFSWKSDVKGSDYTVQISDDSYFTVKFASIKTTSNIVGKKFNINNLPEGNYYWRVIRNASGDNTVSEVRSFSVANYVPGVNKLSWPPDGYSIEYDQLSHLNFSWKLAQEYKDSGYQSVFQISKTKDFNKVEAEERIAEVSYSGASLTSKLLDGDYYWRVGVLQDGRASAFTEPNSLSIQQLLGAPEITLPANGEKLLLAQTDPVIFAWNEVNGADYYKLVIYDEKGTAVKNEKVSGTQAKIKLEQEAASTDFTKYSFTVQAVVKESELSTLRTGEESAASFELRYPLAVKLLSPVNNKRFDGLTALRTPIQFNWETPDKPVYTAFTLQKQTSNGSWRTIRTQENPKKPVSQSRLSEGRYRWNISAKGEKDFSLDSSFESFVITPVPQMDSAQLTEPSKNLRMDASYLKNHRNISFKWKKVSGATDYDFAIYQVLKNGSYKKVYSLNGTKQTEVKIKDLSVFDLGTFEWRVTAYSHAKDGYEEQKSGTSASRFEIEFTLPDKVKTKAPDTLYGE